MKASFLQQDRIVKSSKVRIGDLSISYLIRHAKLPSSKHVIFLHGFPFNKNMWRAQLEALPDNFTGIALDVRGHGMSTSGHGYFSIDVFAKDLGVFIKKLDIQKAVVCGVSMGGYIALRAYELFPASIEALVLSDTHSRSDDNTTKQKRFDTIQAVLKHGRRPFAIGFVANLFSDYSIKHRPDAVELIKSSIRRTRTSSICATLLALAARTDTTQTLPQISVPTLLVRGVEDKITPQYLMQEMAQQIPKAEFIELDQCGHLPNVENPEAFNRALNTFLESL